jgi:hypothetical protein
VCGSKATVAGIYEKGEERRHGWWWWWKGLHGDYSASRAPAQDLFFLSPHFVFIYSALLLFLSRRRGYILLARLIVASDVLVQTTCHERDGDRAAGARDHLVHTRTHIRRENTYTQSLGATGWLALLFKLSRRHPIDPISSLDQLPTRLQRIPTSPHPTRLPPYRPSEDSANYPSVETK